MANISDILNMVATPGMVRANPLVSGAGGTNQLDDNVDASGYSQGFGGYGAPDQQGIGAASAQGPGTADANGLDAVLARLRTDGPLSARGRAAIGAKSSKPTPGTAIGAFAQGFSDAMGATAHYDQVQQALKAKELANLWTRQRQERLDAATQAEREANRAFRERQQAFNEGRADRQDEETKRYHDQWAAGQAGKKLSPLQEEALRQRMKTQSPLWKQLQEDNQRRADPSKGDPWPADVRKSKEEELQREWERIDQLGTYPKTPAPKPENAPAPSGDPAAAGGTKVQPKQPAPVEAAPGAAPAPTIRQGGTVPPQAARDYLRSNPTEANRRFFEQKYGPGSAGAVLDNPDIDQAVPPGEEDAIDGIEEE